MDNVKIELTSFSDEELLKVSEKRRNEVLKIIYTRYERRIYFKAITLLKNKEDALDLSHDIFIKIFTNLNQFKGESKFSLWVHSITFNTCMKYLRDRKKLSFFKLDNSTEIEDKGELDRTEKQLFEMKIESIQECLQYLKKDERYILILMYNDRLKIREISAITGFNESAVKMKLKRSREKLLNYYHKLYQ